MQPPPEEKARFDCRRAICLLVPSLALAVIWGSPLQVSAEGPKNRPNVLFIISDDLRPETGSYGVEGIRTPHIDRLATRSVQFDRAYVQFPVCNPSRSSMLTGLYPEQAGVLDNRQWWGRENPEAITLPRWFRNNGYVTARAGKIFHAGIDDLDAWTEGGEPRRRPADAMEGIDSAAGMPPGMTEPRVPPIRNPHSDRIVVLEGDGSDHGDFRTATRTIEYLEEYKDDDRPFFIACGFVKPHSPPEAPRRFFDLYDPDEMELPVDFAPRPTVPPGFPEISVVPLNRDLFMGRDASEEEAREMKRAYWASVSFMDEQVGRVLRALDRLELREDTIVVFWGDHGYHIGEKGRWSKAYSLFEVAARVPLLISVPGNPNNGKSSDRVVEVVNLYKTLSELAGLPDPPDVNGVSMVPLLRKPDAPWSRPAYTMMAYRDAFGRSIRTERWRYSQWKGGDYGEVLFDHYNDPHELHNLANDPEYADALARMRALMAEVLERVR